MKCSRCINGTMLEEGYHSGYWCCLNCGDRQESRSHTIDEELWNIMIGLIPSFQGDGVNREMSELDRQRALEKAARNQEYINRRGFYPVYPRSFEKKD